MMQFSKRELIGLLSDAFENAETADDAAPENLDYAQHMAQLSIAASLLVIADNLTAMRYNDNSQDIPRIADGVAYLGTAIDDLIRRMP